MHAPPRVIPGAMGRTVASMGWRIACLLLLAACGTRTALDPGEVEAPPLPPPPPPPPPPPTDAGRDAGLDATLPRDSGPPPDAGPPCISGRAVLPAGQVDVVFLIDRSSSMGWQIGTSEEVRWDILQAAMHDVLSDLDPRVSVGASFFPSGPFCELNEALDVPVAPDNMPAVLAAFDRGVIDGRSPIGHAFSNAALALAHDRPEGRNRFVVVLTDGAGSECGWGSWPEEDPTTVRAIYGIETFPVSVAGRGGWLTSALDGGRRDPDTGSYYLAVDLRSLRQVLEEIEAALTGCVFDVALATTELSRVVVEVGGVAVPFDSLRREGWAWSGIERESISLFGAACTGRIAANATVEATVFCDPDAG